jgi:AcrR family transcriptional regulator
LDQDAVSVCGKKWGAAMTARAERVAAEEVRQRMLDAGRELALEAGAALTIEHMRLEEVIQRARVPRSSVYRLWAYREEYTEDLLCYLAGPGSSFADRTLFDPETVTVIGRVLQENVRLLGTLDGRRALMCEVVRLSVARNYAALTESLTWRLQMALMATLGSTRSGMARRRIAAALEDSQRRSRESLVAVLGQISQVIGLRLRDPAYTLDHVQLAGGLLVQSLALRNVQVQAAMGMTDSANDGASLGSAAQEDAGHDWTGPGSAGLDGAEHDGGGLGRAELDGASDTAMVNGLLNVPVPGPGLDGKQAPWTLAAFAYLGVIDAFIELDPDFAPPGT